MTELILYALGTGFLLSFGFGSVFFALIQSSIDYGFKAGRNLAVGVTLSDVVLINFALLGTGFLPNLPNFETYARIVGATLLLGLGISQFRQYKMSESVLMSGVKSTLYFIGKGVMLNVINPINFLAWVVVSTTLKSYQYSLQEEIIFFFFCLLAIFLTETGIAYFAHRIRDRFSEKSITNIKYATGVVFLGIAGKLIWDAVG